MVCNQNNVARVFIINSTAKKVDLTIPPVELEECDVVPTSVRSFKGVENLEKQKQLGLRSARLLEILKLTELSEEERESLIPIIINFSHQFYLPGDKLVGTNVLTHKKITIDKQPIFTKQYRFSAIHRDEIRKQTGQLSNSGILQPSTSPYNPLLLMFPKKSDSLGNKKWRMVIDYRALNEKTVGDAYPLPNLTKILDQLGGSKYFSIMDLTTGFHQIPMDSESKEKTAFSTPYGHLEFNRMPFGLQNALATFQRVMNQVLTGLQRIELFVYMDDIVIYTTSLEEHSRKLKS